MHKYKYKYKLEEYKYKYMYKYKYKYKYKYSTFSWGSSFQPVPGLVRQFVVAVKVTGRKGLLQLFEGTKKELKKVIVGQTL